MTSWVKDQSTDLTKKAVTGQLPTLSAGEYKGIFIGATSDSGGAQWVTVSCFDGTHTEQNDIDVQGIELNDRISFTIDTENGAGLLIKGNRYQLVDKDRNPLTGWTNLGPIYTYIMEHKVHLAGPRLTKITKIPE